MFLVNQVVFLTKRRNNKEFGVHCVTGTVKNIYARLLISRLGGVRVLKFGTLSYFFANQILKYSRSLSFFK